MVPSVTKVTPFVTMVTPSVAMVTQSVTMVTPSVTHLLPTRDESLVVTGVLVSQSSLPHLSLGFIARVCWNIKESYDRILESYFRKVAEHSYSI